MADVMDPLETDDGDLEFRFTFGLPELVAGRFFGVTPESAWLSLHDDRLVARFGPWKVETTLANVAGAELTGPYRWPRIIGPAHISLKDRGLTFASTDSQGVCIRFREPVAGIDPLGVIRHPGLTVTVKDAPALVEVLQHAAELADEEEVRARRHPDRPVVEDPPTLDEVLDEVADDLNALTAKELRQRAKDLGISGVASMKKEELVDLLMRHDTGAD